MSLPSTKGWRCCFLLEYLLLMYVQICEQLSSFVGFLFVRLLKIFTYKVGWGGWGSRDSCEIRHRLYSCCLYMGDTSHVNTCTIRHSYATSQNLWLPPPPGFFSEFVYYECQFVELQNFTGVGRCIHFSKLHKLFIAPQLRSGIAQNGKQTMLSLIFRLSRTASNKSWKVGPGLRLGDAWNQLFYSWTEVALYYVWKWELAGRNWHWQLTFLG